MIDDELLNKFDRIQDLPVSEEMLGAYLEGNVAPNEAIQIESAMLQDTQLSDFINGITRDSSSILNNIENQIFDQTYSNLLLETQLPNIENEIIFENFYENQLVASCYSENLFIGLDTPSSEGLFHQILY